MKNRRNNILFIILGIIGLVIITVGATYALFNYVKQGTTENSLTTNSITFIYEESEANGRGIKLDDAFPISDGAGKAKTGEGNVFNFTISSQTPSNASIPYTITARKSSDSTLLDNDAVKVYLTEVNGTGETELLLNNYGKLEKYVNVTEGTTEMILYTDTVPANSADYEKNYRLRMWIDKDVNFSQNKDGTYPYNGKTFKLTVNVYADAAVVTKTNYAASEITYSNENTECTDISCSLNELYDVFK